MKTMQDIRLYKSDTPNIDERPLPSEIGNKPLAIVVRRITMQLREQDFSLGEFDHLYVNLTTCPVTGGMAPAERSPDRYHPWYRYYDVEIEPSLYERLHVLTDYETVISLLERLLCACFSTDEWNATRIRACIEQAVVEGEHMLMAYKEKKTTTRTATVYLRLLDNGQFRPLLRVLDREGVVLTEVDLPDMMMLDRIGEIQVSAAKVVIKPQKNAFLGSAEPMCFTW